MYLREAIWKISVDSVRYYKGYNAAKEGDPRENVEVETRKPRGQRGKHKGQLGSQNSP